MYDETLLGKWFSLSDPISEQELSDAKAKMQYQAYMNGQNPHSKEVELRFKQLLKNVRDFNRTRRTNH